MGNRVSGNVDSRYVYLPAHSDTMVQVVQRRVGVGEPETAGDPMGWRGDELCLPGRGGAVEEV